MKKEGSWFLVIAFAVMALLFFSSAQTYEQQSQIGLLGRLLHNEPFKASLSKISFDYAGTNISIHTNGYFHFVEFFVRKGAHFLTYFILGFSWFLGLMPRIKSYSLTVIIAWLAATGYAGLDEFHQMLTGGRTPLFQDVVLDSCAALAAVLLFAVIRRLRRGR